MSNSRKVITQKMIELLEQFGSDEKTKPVRETAKILSSAVLKFNALEEKQQTKDIITLRKTLLSYYNKRDIPTVYFGEIEFRKLLSEILIKLAEQFPINDIDPETSLPIDPITWLPINESDRFVTLTGQSFSIENIIKYNRERFCRGSALGEHAKEKYLLNPLTNQPFSPIDSERLIVVAVKKKKELDFLIDRVSDEKEGPGELSQGFSLKDIAFLAKGVDINVTVDLTKELKYTPEDAVACMTIAAQNNELKTFGYLYTLLPQRYKDLLTQPDRLDLSAVIVEQSSAKAFICLTAAYNEPKTLKVFADLLVAADFDLNYQYSMGISAIHLAAQYGSTDSMDVLLDPKYKIQIDQRTHTGATAFNIAARHKKFDIAVKLAKAGANLMIPRMDGEAPIHIAAEHDDAKLMQLLLGHKVNLNQKSGPLDHLRTAVHNAAQYNSEKVLKILLNANADLNMKDEQGLTPLFFAIHYGATEAVKILLQHTDKVSLDQVAGGPLPHTLATAAAEKGNASILKLLAEAKADLEQPRKDDGTTPLHRAVLFGHYEATAFLIKYYLTHHKDIFVKDKKDKSPFVLACAEGYWDIAKLFLNRVKYEAIPKEDKELMKRFHKELGLVENNFISRLFSFFGFQDGASVNPQSTICGQSQSSSYTRQAKF